MPFTITISLSADPAATTATVTGAADASTDPAEAGAFGIDEAGLKALWNAVKGAVPRDVALCDPTALGDLYAQYGWPPVTTSYAGSAGTAVPGASEAVTLATKVVTNDDDQPVTVVPDLSGTTELVATATNDAPAAVAGFAPNTYTIGLAGTAETLNYSAAWDVEAPRSATTTWTAPASPVEIPAHAARTLSLVVQRHTFEVPLTYQFALAGMSEADYEQEINGHHIFGDPINDLLTTSGKPTGITVTERITVTYCAEPALVVT